MSLLAVYHHQAGIAVLNAAAVAAEGRRIILCPVNRFEINRRLSDSVEGALQVADISGHYMGVYLRGLDIRVAEQFLEDADIDPVF